MILADLREKLVELLIEATRKWGCQIGLYGCMADHLIANGVTLGKDINVPSKNVGEWISVTERLPEGSVRVLVYMKPNVYRYTDIDTDRLRRGEFVRWGENVTHWMPLPEPPKEG